MLNLIKLCLPYAVYAGLFAGSVLVVKDIVRRFRSL